MKLFKIILCAICFLSLCSIAAPVEAQTPYTLLAPLPEIGSETTFGNYLPRIFNLAVGIAAGLAFVMITFGGIMYATSDAISGKSAGREYVEDAIWGLLLVIGAWVILNTINPQILEFNLDIPVPPQASSTPTVISPNSPCVAPACQTLASLGLGTPISSGSAVGKGVDPTLGNKLVGLNGELQRINLPWRITEAWPQSRVHKNSCHRVGTCIDANIDASTPQNIKKFLDAGARAGLFVEYEVTSQGEKDRLVKEGGIRPVQILVLPPINGVPQISAPHFSVYRDRK